MAQTRASTMHSPALHSETRPSSTSWYSSIQEPHDQKPLKAFNTPKYALHKPTADSNTELSTLTQCNLTPKVRCNAVRNVGLDPSCHENWSLGAASDARQAKTNMRQHCTDSMTHTDAPCTAPALHSPSMSAKHSSIVVHCEWSCQTLLPRIDAYCNIWEKFRTTRLPPGQPKLAVRIMPPFQMS